MKYRFLLVAWLSFYLAQAQSTRNFVGLSAARTTVDAIQFADTDGGGSSDTGHGYRIGGQYQRLLTPHVALEGSLYLAQLNYSFVSAFYPDVETIIQPRRYRTISLLVRPKYYVNTQRIRFYLVAGASIDVQTYALVDEDNNSGLGAQLGAGLEATVGRRMLVSLEPSVRMLALVPFVAERYRWRAATAGVQLGVYYEL